MKEEVYTCRRCGRTLPISMFYKNKKYANGHDTWCKECDIAYHKELQQIKIAKQMESKRQNALTPQSKQQDPAILYANIQHVSDEDIVKEIRRRGYTGQLEFSKVVTI